MQLVFASNNKYKIKEIQLVLPDTIQILSLEDIGCMEEILETATSFEGNAILKANYITQKYGYDCFADDSGLEVEGLNGQPGVYSARYAGEQRNDEDNIDKLLLNINGIDNRKANFRTVICLNRKGKQYLFEGNINGEITHERKGLNGFGYDSVFMPYGYAKTFADFSNEEKAKISHRAIAVRQLVEHLSKVE